MSYDVVFWLFLNLLGCGLGVALIAARRPGWGAIAAGLVAVAYMTKLRWVPAYAWSLGASYPVTPGVYHEHVLAAGTHERARWALGLLPWAVLPLLVCAWGCVVAARKKKSSRPLLWILPASVPSAVLLFWIVSASFHWSSDDPRWSMGYLEEWREEGRQSTHGGSCYGFLVDQARLVGLVPEDTLARARSECGQLCREQAARRSFNPGILEGKCREAGLLP
ncbi:hypothetical protein [Polyangium aurulentum]|uniref:hypothetical protein n=1 Tax=Polyangium aurulentum TaxID=2567896 RepID=UPI0010AE4BC6|nr:hypothetical protein [Polyangium aurulentum]UQA57652.1 hypothetical protein E8A73_041290 [Polyangium aurulentum]